MRWILASALALGLAGCGGRAEEAKKVVAAELRDPSSAQFKDVLAYSGHVCGLVNGKNALGGYAGFRRFIAQGSVVTIAPDLPSAVLTRDVDPSLLEEWQAHNAFRSEWQRRCPQNETKPSIQEEAIENQFRDYWDDKLGVVGS